MRERKRGTLRSGRSGQKVTSRKQAIAIGLSEARREGAKVPSRRGKKRRSTKRRATKRSTAKRRTAKRRTSRRTGRRTGTRASRKRAA
jgi:hypothetical protein